MQLKDVKSMKRTPFLAYLLQAPSALRPLARTDSACIYTLKRTAPGVYLHHFTLLTAFQRFCSYAFRTAFKCY